MPQNDIVPNPAGYKYRDEELAIWDREDPRSLINMLPPDVGARMEETMRKSPDIFNLDEQTLRKALKTLKKAINTTDDRLRFKFWMEFDNCKEHDIMKMNISRVIDGICSRELFYKFILREPGRVAWLLCPPADYLFRANESLSFALDQLRDILGQSHILRNGKVDGNLARLKVQIFKLLEDRIRGAVVQKVATTTVSLEIDPTEKKMLLEHATNMSSESLKNKIANLESRERKALHIPTDTDPLVPVEPLIVTDEAGD